MSDDLLSRLTAAQDRAADLDLLRAALGVQSVTGNETPFARFLAEEMGKLGLAVGRGAFLDGRENVWGAKAAAAKPDARRQTLMFVGRDPFGAAEVDGAIWGRGPVT